MPADDMAANLAAQAAADPRIQAAAQQQAQQAVAQAAEQGQRACCTSFTRYNALVLSRPKLQLEEFSFSREDWLGTFRYWNVVWAQTQVLAFCVYLACLLILCIPGFQAWTFIKNLFGRSIYGISVHLLALFGYTCIGDPGCCAGNAVFFVWGMLYLVAAPMCLAATETAWPAYVASTFLVIPTFYVCLACWKLGGGSTARNLGNQLSAGIQQRMTTSASRAPASEPAATAAAPGTANAAAPATTVAAGDPEREAH
mmetsp:Transcript_101318/g.254033  ORF Transcript_101318/g.254033 Transcript_101318/m.254033 type:complete len:256 (-) Transcript_101318:273-1040(-)